jgi:hypothetical protein
MRALVTLYRVKSTQTQLTRIYLPNPSSLRGQVSVALL